MSRQLDELTREARDHLGKDQAAQVDWAAVDRALFARVERAKRDERGRFVTPGRRRAALLGVAAALAAAWALTVHGDRLRDEEALTKAGDPSGGRIAAVEDGCQVSIDGRPAARGATLHLGDVLEVKGGSIVVERAGKLTMRVEAGTRAAVTHTEGALVLALAQGAVEAQVVPVPNGEAFAVDVAGSRVAVHGTHLRVARSAGDRVTVDLSEGVVVVGSAPRVGSVVGGSLVTAPAHAEFGAADIRATLAVAHDRAAVRSPVPLGPSAQPAQPGAVAAPVEPVATVATVALAPSPPARPSLAVARPDLHPVAPPVPAPSSAPVADANPEQVLSGAVRACLAERAHAENVTVLVSTTLHLDLNDDGSVRAARFEPPVAPDVSACSAAAIYRTRFSHGGSAQIEIDVRN